MLALQGLRILRGCTITLKGAARPARALSSISHFTKAHKVNYTKKCYYSSSPGTNAGPVSGTLTPEFTQEEMVKMKNALQLLQKNLDVKGATEHIEAAIALRNNTQVKTTAAIMASAFRLYELGEKYAKQVFDENKIDDLPGGFLFAMAIMYYDLLNAEMSLASSTAFLKKGKDSIATIYDVPTACAIRVVCLTTLGRYDEALEASNKLDEHLTVVPKTHAMYTKILDAKWSNLLCQFHLKNTQKKDVDLVKMCFEIVFQHTPLEDQPMPMAITANRIVLFRDILKNYPARIPEALERFKEMVGKENVHAHWKSLATMLIVDLSPMSDIQRATESYRGIMFHPNTYSIMATLNLSGATLAAIPGVDRDRFLLALDEFAQILFLNRENLRHVIPTEKPINFWKNLAVLSFNLHDLNRARNFAECGIQFFKDNSETDTHILNRIIATCYLLRKEFAKSVTWCNVDKGKVDALHANVLATSHVALGGEENFQKAFEYLKMINSGPASAEEATKQLNILKSQRDKLLSEEVSFEGLVKNWRALNSIGSPHIPLQEAMECADKILNLPEVSTPLLAIFRYDAINRRGGLYKDSNNLAKAIENFEIVEKEFPIMALYSHMRLCYYHLGQVEKLIAVLHKLLNLTSNPVDIDNYLGELAIVHIDIGNPGKAYEYLMQCTDKTSKGWLENMADACKISNKKEEAIKYITQLIERPDSDKALGHLIRATIYVLMGRIEEAKADYEKVVDDPNLGAKATVGLAKVYETNLNDNAKALQMYASVVDKLPVDAHEGSATCLFKMNLNELALEQIELSFKHTQGTKNPWALLLRGNIYGSMENPEKAYADFTEVINMKEEHAAEAYFSRGKINYILNMDEASTDFANAIKLEPSREAQIQEFKSGIDSILNGAK